MGPTDLMLIAAEVLERFEIRYFVAGSMASSMYGEFRLTADVDIVIALGVGNIKELVKAFPPDDYYVSEEAVREALEHCSQFNVIHARSGLKIDFMTPDEDGYTKVRFDRARRTEVAPGRSVWVAAPEDVILKKLEHAQMGGSDKHARDIAGMIRISGDQIDRAYLEKWAAHLGVVGEWMAVKSRVGW